MYVWVIPVDGLDDKQIMGACQQVDMPETVFPFSVALNVPVTDPRPPQLRL